MVFRLAAYARHVGHPKVIIQGDTAHALIAVIHDAYNARHSTFFFSSRMATICVHTVSIATKTLTIGASDTNVAPTVIRQMGESMMSPLVTGWLISRKFNHNWRFHFFSSHQSTFHFFVNEGETCPVCFHKCQQHPNNSLTLQKEKPQRCEFNRRTIESLQKLFAAWIRDSMPLSINLETLRISRFKSTTVKLTPSFSPDPTANSQRQRDCA